MLKTVHHVVTRPGRTKDDPDVEIPVAEDLATVPGIPQKEDDVAFYSRVYPLETQNIEKAADREWVWTVYEDDIRKYREDTTSATSRWSKPHCTRATSSLPPSLSPATTSPR